MFLDFGSPHQKHRIGGTLGGALRDGSDGWRSPVRRGDSTGGRDCLHPPPTIAFQSRRQVPYIVMVCGQCTRWLVLYVQTGATLLRHLGLLLRQRHSVSAWTLRRPCCGLLRQRPTQHYRRCGVTMCLRLRSRQSSLVGDESLCPRLRWTVSYSSSHRSFLAAVPSQSFVMGAVCGTFLRIEHRDREMVNVFARWPSRRDDKVFLIQPLMYQLSLKEELVRRCQNEGCDKANSYDFLFFVCSVSKHSARLFIPLQFLSCIDLVRRRSLRPISRCGRCAPQPVPYPWPLCSTVDLDKLHFDQPFPGSPVSR